MLHDDTPSVTYREVPRMPGYRFGDDGSIWSRKQYGHSGMFRKEWRRLKPRPNRGGYPFLVFRVGGKAGGATVHKLILEAFVGPRPDGMVCRHLDGNRLNNRLDNLRWGTPGENEADKVIHGTAVRPKGSANGLSKLTESDIPKIVALRRDGMSFGRLAKQFRVSPATIHGIIHGTKWTHVKVE